jgi:transcriptional regulator with XRE-family HTH domain
MTGQELREWRKKLGLSQAALARHLGVTRVTVTRWEIGLRPVPSFLGLAMRALEIDLREERDGG